MALTLYEDGLCAGCGHPKAQAYNPDAEGWFEPRDVICFSCAAQQVHREELAKKENPKAGVKVYSVNTLPSGQDLRPWKLPSAGSGPVDGTDHDQHQADQDQQGSQ